MRGEDKNVSSRTKLIPGSPPHARGRQRDTFEKTVLERITPACAGKTKDYMKKIAASEDHPRMRGEDS